MSNVIVETLIMEEKVLLQLLANIVKILIEASGICSQLILCSFA